MLNSELVDTLCGNRQPFSLDSYQSLAEVSKAIHYGMLRLLFSQISAGTELCVRLNTNKELLDINTTIPLILEGNVVVDFIPLSCSIELQPITLTGWIMCRAE